MNRKMRVLPDLAFRIYGVMIQFYPRYFVRHNRHIIFKTRRHSEMTERFLEQHFLTPPIL